MEKRGLAATLYQLVKDAEAQPGKPQRKTLFRGLRVDVLILDGEVHLQISRDYTWPHKREWSTVTRDWPTLVPKVTTKQSYHQGRYYLMAKWEHMRVEQDALSL